MLPNVNVGMTNSDFYQSGSFMDAKSSASNAKQTGTHILFLKRLLFLKASLDNETQINTFAVPFEEDKAFRAANSNS